MVYFSVGTFICMPTEHFENDCFIFLQLTVYSVSFHTFVHLNINAL